MPPEGSSKKPSNRCTHSKLSFCETSNAKEVGFNRATLEQRITATTLAGTVKPTKSKSKTRNASFESPSTFPAPHILPGDELSWDPNSPPQSLRSYIREKHRNHVTPEQRTLYLVPPPETESSVNFIKKWSIPKQKTSQKIKQPDMNHIQDYLSAFYHPLPVKLLPSNFMRFSSTISDLPDIPNEHARKIIGLKTPLSGSKGIRTRPTPMGDFSHQLNLNDLLDAAIWSLPDDAYALLMLVDHDIYEDEEDDFACGRAYGGSRIAVVSIARYHPVLDEKQGLEREHAWPASHCVDYLRGCCVEEEEEEGEKRPRRRKGKEVTVVEDSDSDSDAEMISSVSPMRAAVDAHSSLPSLDEDPSSPILTGLWLGRVCRTASHELGHCFGIAHCVYYACSMQGTASIVEDSRQPPFLCPVDLAKVLKSTGGDVKERYRALLAFCEEYEDVHLFAAYGAWIKARLEEMSD